MATVEDILNSATSRVNSAISGSQTFIQELRNAATQTIYLSYPGVNEDQDLEVTINLEGNVAISPVVVDDIDLIDEVDLETRYNGFQSNLDTVGDLLNDDLLNGGYGLLADDERPVWERGKDRIVKAVEAELSVADRVSAARGFTLPTGAQAILARKAQESVTQQVAALNLEITINQINLRVEQRKFAIAETIQLGLSRLQSEISIVDSILRNQQHAINLAIEQARMDIDVAKTNATLGSDNNRALLDKNRILLDKWQTKVNAYYKAIDAKISNANGSVTAFAQVASLRLKAAEAGVDLYSKTIESAQNSLSAIATLAE